MQEDIGVVKQNKTFGREPTKKKMKNIKGMTVGNGGGTRKLKMRWPILNYVESSKESWYRGERSD